MRPGMTGRARSHPPKERKRKESVCAAAGSGMGMRPGMTGGARSHPPKERKRKESVCAAAGSGHAYAAVQRESRFSDRMGIHAKKGGQIPRRFPIAKRALTEFF